MRGSRLTLQEQVYRRLRGELMAGRLAAGQRLTVRELSQRMGTSPMPVREAMRRLVAEQALELLPNGSVRVRLMSEAERADWREIRILLESMAVSRAAERIGPSEIAEARRLNETMRRAIEERRIDDYMGLNREFHFLCYRAARSEILFEVIEGLWVQAGPFLRLYVLDTLERRPHDGLFDLFGHHDSLLDAFEQRDGEAAAAALRTDLGRTSATRESEEPEYLRAVYAALKGKKEPNAPPRRAEASWRAQAADLVAVPRGRAELPAATSSRQTLQEQVYRQLHRALTLGEVLPGQVVTVRSFADRFGTSPMPVREALRRLVAERVFESLPNGSLRVRLMSEEQRNHAREIRAFLEGVALSRAALQITPEELAEAERLNEQMKQAIRRSDFKAAMLANNAYHFLLYRAARSEVLLSLIERLWAQNGPFIMLHLIDLLSRSPAESHGQLTAHHDVMLAALARRDAATAATALVADLMQTGVTHDSEAPILLGHLPDITLMT